LWTSTSSIDGPPYREPDGPTAWLLPGSLELLREGDELEDLIPAFTRWKLNRDDVARLGTQETLSDR
jgi:hypothetical protein